MEILEDVIQSHVEAIKDDHSKTAAGKVRKVNPERFARLNSEVYKAEKSRTNYRKKIRPFRGHRLPHMTMADAQPAETTEMI